MVGGGSFYILVLASALFNHFSGLLIGRLRGKAASRLLLAFSITVNLGLLAWYKYANFFVSNLKVTTGYEFAWSEVALPVGISFFTFHAISSTLR